MRDWMIRALKTFAQAFLGTFIPALCAMLNNGFPESISKAWVVLGPVIAAAISAGVAAAWNIILEKLKTEG